MKKRLINNTIKVLNTISKKSISTSCIWAIHQPKEPKALQK